MDYKKFPEKKFNHILGSPFIYAMIFPFFILDFFLEIYHQICFRLYGLPLVNRANYIVIDRHKLSYLEPIDKLNCVYCGYANGLLAYASEISAQTEKYWCGIKHAEYPGIVSPSHHETFIQYGDEEAFKSISEPAIEDCKLNQTK